MNELLNLVLLILILILGQVELTRTRSRLMKLEMYQDMKKRIPRSYYRLFCKASKYLWKELFPISQRSTARSERRTRKIIGINISTTTSHRSLIN